MMRLLAAFLFLLAPGLMAQQLLLEDSRQAGKPMEANTGLEIKGSVFLNDQPATLLVAIRGTSNFLRITQGRLNVLNDRFEYESDGKKLFLDPNLYERILLLVMTDTLEFRNGLTDASPYSKKSYFQVLVDGKSRWVKKPVKTLVASPDAAYGSTKQKMVQDDVFYYIISPAGVLEKFKPSKKFFVKRYPQLDVSLEAFIKEKGTNFDRDADLQALIRWIEERP